MQDAGERRDEDEAMDEQKGTREEARCAGQ